MSMLPNNPVPQITQLPQPHRPWHRLPSPTAPWR